MSKSNFRIDIDKISEDLKQVVPNFTKKTLESICEVTRQTIYNWGREAPEVVELVYYNAEVCNVQFLALIKEKAHLFPVLRLLKQYEELTGKEIKSVIIKN